MFVLDIVIHFTVSVKMSHSKQKGLEKQMMQVLDLSCNFIAFFDTKQILLHNFCLPHRLCFTLSENLSLPLNDVQ